MLAAYSVTSFIKILFFLKGDEIHVSSVTTDIGLYIADSKTIRKVISKFNDNLDISP